MSNLNSPALPERAIERLFARFVAMFGQSAMQRMWLDVPLDEVKGAWADSLSRFTVDELLRGLRNIEADGRSFPPTLPEFMAACRRKAESVPAMHRPALAPPPRTAEEIAAGKALADRIAREVRAKPAQTNPRAWAERVIERYQAGDKSVAHASYKIACEALREFGEVKA
jgi:hypothetical protein